MLAPVRIPEIGFHDTAGSRCVNEMLVADIDTNMFYFSSSFEENEVADLELVFVDSVAPFCQ